MELLLIALSVILMLSLLLLFRLLTKEQARSSALEQTLAQSRISEATAIAQTSQLNERLQQAQQYSSELSATLIDSQSKNADLSARLELTERTLTTERQERGQIIEELQARFRIMASEVLAERSSALEQRNGELLAPLREDLQRFTQKVETTYNTEARERFSLQEQIKELVARSMQLGQEADQLSRALRGEAKVQGNWGEMVLEKILEGSGLERGKEYFVQDVVHDDDGSRYIPDVVVRYPNGGSIVIDSKVSLTAYTNYVNAESDDERKLYAAQHVQSLQRHIEGLSGKSYETLVDQSAGFVMMFVPNEPAYALAIQHRPTLWEEAYKKQVILMNGTNLIAALRMALDLWQRDRQIRNVESIVDEASKMYDAFVRFTEKMVDAERHFDKAQAVLQEARRSLTESRGNLIGRFDKLRKMGLRTKRSFPDALTRELDTDTDE